jgi:integrase
MREVRRPGAACAYLSASIEVRGDPLQVARVISLVRSMTEHRGEAGEVAADQPAAMSMLEDLLADYATSMVRTEAQKHVTSKLALLRRAFVALNAVTVQDLAGATSAFERYLAGLGKAESTLNAHLGAMRSFCDWLVSREFLAKNPFASIAYLERIHAGSGSYVFSEAQSLAMIAVAEDDERAAVPRYNARRSEVYRTAFYTGMRHREMLLLRVQDVRLSDDPADRYITVTRAAAKGRASSRRERHIPIADALYPTLVECCRGKQGKDWVFPREPSGKRLFHDRVLHGDAVAAGIQIRARTLRLGLHSFRKACITALAASGAPMAVTAAIAGHTDPKLTLQVYTAARLLPLREAVNSLTQKDRQKYQPDPSDGLDPNREKADDDGVRTASLPIQTATSAASIAAMQSSQTLRREAALDAVTSRCQSPAKPGSGHPIAGAGFEPAPSSLGQPRGMDEQDLALIVGRAFLAGVRSVPARGQTDAGSGR